MAFRKVHVFLRFFSLSFSLSLIEKRESEGLPGRNKQRTASMMDTVHRLPLIYCVSGLFCSQKAEALAFCYQYISICGHISPIFDLFNYSSLPDWESFECKQYEVAAVVVSAHPIRTLAEDILSMTASENLGVGSRSNFSYL
ncbi:hypothetical protein WUBG_14263 [Wuchereria bancrofti]|uniref:Uncharacterized protein n=1 Tax=Wuchereria bancrofti TaxID=6293 RepID=J9DYL2_WUCBA|nr:hypothetical protein WUBG_14263 [Wuchereria bancrofti]